MQRDLAPFGSPVGDQQQVADLGNLQCGAADPRLVDQSRRIEQPVKIKMSAGAKISSQLFGQLLLPLDPLAVTRRREPHHLLVSKRRRGVNGQQLAQLIELKHAFAGVLDGTGRTHRVAFYGTGGMERSRSYGRSFSNRTRKTRAVGPARIYKLFTGEQEP